MRNELKRFFLRALHRMDGAPLPQSTLLAAARTAFPGVLESEISDAHRQLEADGFLAGNRDDLDGQVTWTLTVKGKHKASSLG